VRSRLAIAALVTCGAVAIAWQQRAHLWWAWWDWSSARPLNEAHEQKVDACDEVSWAALRRVLAQPVLASAASERCGALWLPEQVAHVSNKLAVAWLDDFAADPVTLPVQRLPIVVGRWLATGSAQAELSLVLDRTPGGAAVVDAMGDERWSHPELRADLHPALLSAAQTRRFVEEPGPLRAHGADVLGRWAWWPLGPVDIRPVQVAAMDASEWDEAGLERVRLRRAAKRSLGPVDESWRARLAGDVRCGEPLERACALALADRLTETLGHELIAPSTVADPLWEAIFPEDARAWHAAAQLVAERARWVGHGVGQDGAARLALVDQIGGGPTPGVLAPGDPAAVLLGAEGGVWTRLLALWVVAAAADMEPAVYEDNGTPWLQVRGRAITAGGVVAAPPPPGAYVPLPPSVLVARAADEGARGREHTEPQVARRLHQLAATLEPSAFDVREPLDGPDASAGRRAGLLVRALR